jgi:hypothetical protein
MFYHFSLVSEVYYFLLLLAQENLMKVNIFKLNNNKISFLFFVIIMIYFFNFLFTFS